MAPTLNQENKRGTSNFCKNIQELEMRIINQRIKGRGQGTGSLNFTNVLKVTK